MRSSAIGASLIFLSALSLATSRVHFIQSAPSFDRALAEFQNAEFGKAAQDFAEVESGSPGATDALLYRAKCLSHLEKFAEADSSVRSYIAQHPQSDEALYLLGFILNRENKPSESLQVFTRAAAIHTPTGDDLKIVGLDYVLLNDYPDAIHWLAKATEFESRNKDAWYYLGRAYYSVGSLTDAQKAFQNALALDPHDAKSENNLGLIFESQARQNDAMGAYQNAIAWQEKSPHPSEQPYLNLGSLFLQTDRAVDAISPLRKAIELAPGGGGGHLLLGNAYFRTGKITEAQQEFETATRLDPGNAAAHYQLGRLLKELHETDRAKAEFNRASELQERAARSTPAVPQP